MAYLVIGHRSGDGWAIDVQGEGSTAAEDLSGIETAARILLASNGREDASTADLQLLMPDFETDLQHDKSTFAGGFDMTAGLLAGVIALAVVCIGFGFLISLLF